MEVANTDRRVNAALIGSAGESQAVQVAGTREFIEMLSTNLYSRPKEAMIREVLCNADDAHKEAGYTGPIEITFDDENTLTIRDRGLGIPHESLQPIYGVYGASTKKKDSMATGGFGLGCKSPWSYSDAFTVTNSHGGIRTINSMLRVSAEHDGLPAIVPLAQFPTEETGLEVRIDIKASDRTEFIGLIRSLVARGGMNATLNGEELDRIEYPEDQCYVLVTNSHLSHRIMVKYGAVLYPVENHELYSEYFTGITRYLSRGHTLVLIAPPDSLVISPNRENVSYLDKTIKQLWTSLREFMKEINRKAEPYARKLIRQTNEANIRRSKLAWLNNIHHTGYLDSPTTNHHFYKMDVFDQIIHVKLTYEYPTHLDRMALNHRFKLSMTHASTPWLKKMLLGLKDIKLNSIHTVGRAATRNSNNFLREVVTRELLTIVHRLGLDAGRIRFGQRSQFYFDGRHTSQAQLLLDIRKKYVHDLGNQTVWMYAPIILTHTVKGINEMQGVIPNQYFAYVIPRSGPGHVDPAGLADKLRKFGLNVLDITGEQKLASGTKVKKATGFPTIGYLRSKPVHRTSDGRVKLNGIYDCPKSDLVEKPTAYLKVYIRGDNDVHSPMNFIGGLFNTLQFLLDDDTAVVTTDADIKKLEKLGAVPFERVLEKKIIEVWSDPKVRRLYAWLAPDGAHGTRHENRSAHSIRSILSSKWYRDTFDLPDILEPSIQKKLNYISSVWAYKYYVMDGALNLKPLIKQIEDAGSSEPKKLTKVFDFLKSNPILQGEIDIDDILSMRDKASNPKVVDQLSRILSIIME